MPLHTDQASVLMLLPSLRISGGVQEALRLAEGLQGRGIRVDVLVLWRHAHESSHASVAVHYLLDRPPSRRRALLEAPILFAGFFHFIRRWVKSQHSARSLLLTHYTTFPFAWMTPQTVERYCFNQDLEWTFAPPGVRRFALRKLILYLSQRARVVTTNSYVTHQYRLLGVSSFAQASIWARPFWLSPRAVPQRSVDVVMLLRGGAIKRLDLYLKMLSLIGSQGRLRCAAITPDATIAEQLRSFPVKVFLRPGNDEMKALYGDSKIFLLLSDVEGFGLPPLEAMGSGCVPVCRDAGGVGCYMQGALAQNKVPLGESLTGILKRLQYLLANPGLLAELSKTSTRTFQLGMDRSQKERERAFDVLAQAMQP